MSINLVKGQTIDLRKPENGSVDNNLSKVTIGLGWDINESGGTYDLDAIALLLDKDGKLNSSSDVVYYGQKTHTSGKIWSTGDNLTGEGEGDDEQIIVKLDEIPTKYERIVFFTSIYGGSSKGQEFSKIENAFIRAVDATGKEITKYNISGDSSLKGKRSFIFAEAYRKDGSWKFRAIGEAYETDSLMKIAESYKSGSGMTPEASAASPERKKFLGIF